jgi:hypothetical protein
MTRTGIVKDGSDATIHRRAKDASIEMCADAAADTSGRVGAACTAFNFWWDAPAQECSAIRRGMLGDWLELFDDDHNHSPQNIWPDSHEWVLNTDPDSWATAISGTTNLIEDLLRSPDLDVVRLRA